MSAPSSSEKTLKTGDEVILQVRGTFKDYGDGNCAVLTSFGSVVFTNDERVTLAPA